MGELKSIYTVGCPSIDALLNTEDCSKSLHENKI